MQKISVVLILLVAGCSDRNGTTQSSSTITLTSLEEINAEARKIRNLRSLIIGKDEKILSEKYFLPYTADSLDHVRSVTKSVIGILIGIAVDQKVIRSVDQPISDFLGDKYPKYMDKLEKITIWDLLTMTGGFKWDESSVSTFNAWVTSRDPIRYVLDKKLVNQPGTKFEYNSAGPHLLSAILAEASGMSTFDFAKRHLFAPLNIQGIRWQKIRPYYNGGAGLELKPMDMFKIGKLMINDGLFEGRQIVSSKWINESIKMQTKVGGSMGYGYLWWTEQDVGERNAAAIGFAGQFIVILPDLEVVVTASSNWRSLGKGRSGIQEQQIAKLLSETVYPYVKAISD